MATVKTTKEGNMCLSTRIPIKRIRFRRTLPALVVIALLYAPGLTLAEEDSCREAGIHVRNRTGINVWYTRNGGPCTIWNDDHILIIKPEETLNIYRDMICTTEYCPKHPTYEDYKSLDTDQNCRVRILPNCNLSDM